jgi:hypothetical protein
VGVVAAASPVLSSGFGAAVAPGPPVRLIPAPATLPLAEIVARLNAAQPPALQCYASKLADVAREQLAGQLRIAPRSVTSISEELTAGLAETGSEAIACHRHGSSGRPSCCAAQWNGMSPLALNHGVAGQEELDAVAAAAADPSVSFIDALNVAAWGRVPCSGAAR